MIRLGVIFHCEECGRSEFLEGGGFPQGWAWVEKGHRCPNSATIEDHAHHDKIIENNSLPPITRKKGEILTWVTN